MARLRILHAIHDFLPRHRAGSEIYVSQLCQALSARHDVWILCAEFDPARPHGSLTWRFHDGLPVVELVNTWAFDSLEDTYRSPGINESLRHVLQALQPDVLHVHNLMNLSTDLPALAQARGIPTVATLHDYTLVCASGGQRVHVAESHVCTQIDTTRCSRCFAESPLYAQMAASQLAPRRVWPWVGTALRSIGRRVPGLAARLRSGIGGARAGLAAQDFDERLVQARRVFRSVELFVAPSQAMAQEFGRLGLQPERLRVWDYGIRPFAPSPSTSPGGRLRIGFVGTLVWHKGAHVLLDAVQRLPADRFEVKVFGDPLVFPSYGRSLRVLAAGMPVSFMGPFGHERVAEVYAGIDVLVVPSLWPENSPLVIHEALHAGVPVVGARTGGVAELVTHGVNGLLYEPFDTTALAAALRRLLDEPGLLDRLARSLPPVKTIEEDARVWEEIYLGVLDGRVRSGSGSESQ